MNIDLRNLFCETEQYKSWKFPAGEVQFAIENLTRESNITIDVRLTSGDAIIMLAMTVDAIKRNYPYVDILVNIGYMPYQQADKVRDEGGDCLPIAVIASLLNSLDVDQYVVYDPHSDVTPALLKNCKVIRNDNLVDQALQTITNSTWATNPINKYGACSFKRWQDDDSLALVSPDAGAFKKLFPLAKRLGFAGLVLAANKSRSEGGDITTSIDGSKLEGKNVLITDDLCLGGKTFTQLADVILPFKPASLSLCVSHGIFNYGVAHLKEYFKHIFCTDTYQDKVEGVNVYSWHV